MAALAVLFREALPSGAVLAWAAAAGLVGGAGLACLYRALAVGKMGLNAPLSSVVAVLVPLVFSFFSEGLPHAWRLAGCVVALVSIWLIAGSNDGTGYREQGTGGLGLALAAGLGLGGFLLLIKFAGSSAVFWPLVVARAGSSGLMLVMIAVSRDEWRPATGSLRWILLAGLLDTGANALYVIALQRGSLAVAAVLSSLYPASTVILARLVLKERWSRLQGLGMATALVAVAMVNS
jgi:drug/metabolite transporter (DMT)-like permease